MCARPTFELSRLRKLGWSQWDPIGLRGLEGTPDDEYDVYLLQAVRRLWQGESERAVTDYLVEVETRNMGLPNAPGARQRAASCVRALGEYVSQLRDRQERSL